MIVWFTGLPASGKSTLARRLRERLRSPSVILDGDELRGILGASGYGADDRETFYRVMGALAVMLARQGHVVLVAATAARRSYRDAVRGKTARFVEVWVRTPLAECERRDVKGLYARARAGNAPTLPGLGAAYEEPRAPDIIAEGGFDDAALSQLEHLVVGAALEPAPVMTLPRTILVATDFSEQADAAVAYAAELAARLDATLHFVHAITVPALGFQEMGIAYASVTIESLTRDAQNALDACVARHRERVSIGTRRLEVGDPRDIIDSVAAAIRADLIVMGTHGRRGVRRFLLGSVAESVVRSAPCPVLTVPPRH